MLNITVDNMLRIKAGEINRYPDLKAKIQSDLTLDNPAYISCLKRGTRPWKIPKTLKLWKYVDGVVEIPRGYLADLSHYTHEAGIPVNPTYNVITLPHIIFKSSIKLRDYQAMAIAGVMQAVGFVGQGIVVGPCGCGKTQIGLEIMAEISQPTLWICHTKELLYQTVDRAASYLGLDKNDIGIIGGGQKCFGKELTVGLVQTLVKMDIPVEIFGLIIVDEVHHCPSYTFDSVIQRFPAAYRYGLTATKDREDGMTPAMLATIGPILHTIPREAVPTVTPRLEIIYTKCRATGASYTELLDDLIKNEVRNGLIVETVREHAAGNYCLVLSDRIEHLEILKDILRRDMPGARIDVITGTMGKKDRERVMSLAVARKIDILLATQLAREGLDIPHLNRLFLVTPKRAKGAVQQEVGRIMRPCSGKGDAVVFDFVDDIGMMWAQFRERKKVYMELGMMG